MKIILEADEINAALREVAAEKVRSVFEFGEDDCCFEVVDESGNDVLIDDISFVCTVSS